MKPRVGKKGRGWQKVKARTQAEVRENLCPEAAGGIMSRCKIDSFPPYVYALVQGTLYCLFQRKRKGLRPNRERPKGKKKKGQNPEPDKVHRSLLERCKNAFKNPTDLCLHLLYRETNTLCHIAKLRFCVKKTHLLE
jgi:hypothetical protein